MARQRRRRRFCLRTQWWQGIFAELFLRVYLGVNWKKEDWMDTKPRYDHMLIGHQYLQRQVHYLLKHQQAAHGNALSKLYNENDSFISRVRWASQHISVCFLSSIGWHPAFNLCVEGELWLADDSKRLKGVNSLVSSDLPVTWFPPSVSLL